MVGIRVGVSIRVMFSFSGTKVHPLVVHSVFLRGGSNNHRGGPLTMALNHNYWTGGGPTPTGSNNYVTPFQCTCVCLNWKL